MPTGKTREAFCGHGGGYLPRPIQQSIQCRQDVLSLPQIKYGTKGGSYKDYLRVLSICQDIERERVQVSCVEGKPGNSQA